MGSAGQTACRVHKESAFGSVLHDCCINIYYFVIQATIQNKQQILLPVCVHLKRNKTIKKLKPKFDAFLTI